MSEQSAKLGDTVTCAIRGMLQDGTEFTRTQTVDGLTLRIGDRTLFPLLEDAIIGLKVGSSTEVKLMPEDAYGKYDSEKVFDISLKKIPQEVTVKRGVSLKLENGEGREYDAVVTDVGRKSITVDANHPLAGNELTYELTLLEIL